MAESKQAIAMNAQPADQLDLFTNQLRRAES